MSAEQILNTKDMETKHTTFKDRPINPKTGLPYREGTKKFNEWVNNLSKHDKGVYADLTM